jgi:hypothetical protein
VSDDEQTRRLRYKELNRKIRLLWPTASEPALQYEIDNLEIERDVLQARVSELEASAAVPEGLTLVPVIATREIEDAIGRNRNMKACEIWEEAVSVASKNTQQTGAANKSD